MTNTRRLPATATILAFSLGDIAIDLLTPTIIFALLAPTGLSATVRLSIGGFVVAAKAFCGNIVADSARRIHRLIVAFAIAATSSATTITLGLSGYSDRVAVLAGAAILVAAQAISTLRRRQPLDGFAALVVLELVATVLLISVSDDPRLVLLRPSFYTTIAAVYVLATVRSSRPFMMRVSKPMAADGDPRRAAAFEEAGRVRPAFLRAERAMTLLLAVTLFGEAALRTIVVLGSPDNLNAANTAWAQVPSLALFAGFLVVALRVYVPRARREVDAVLSESRSTADAG